MRLGLIKFRILVNIKDKWKGKEIRVQERDREKSESKKVGKWQVFKERVGLYNLIEQNFQKVVCDY